MEAKYYLFLVSSLQRGDGEGFPMLSMIEALGIALPLPGVYRFLASNKFGAFS